MQCYPPKAEDETKPLSCDNNESTKDKYTKAKENAKLEQSNIYNYKTSTMNGLKKNGSNRSSF